MLEGFSLHADTAVHGHGRAGLGLLCRYGARGPVAECRLKKLEDGRYRYTPKKGVAFTVTAAALVKAPGDLVEGNRTDPERAKGAITNNVDNRAVRVCRIDALPGGAGYFNFKRGDLV